MSARTNAPVDRVWAPIGGCNALPDWHPAVETPGVEPAGTTSVRNIGPAGGSTIVERLEQLDESERPHAFSIVEGPLPVANDEATLRVCSAGNGKTSVIEWRREFQPAGVPERGAV